MTVEEFRTEAERWKEGKDTVFSFKPKTQKVPMRIWGTKKTGRDDSTKRVKATETVWKDFWEHCKDCNKTGQLTMRRVHEVVHRWSMPRLV